MGNIHMELGDRRNLTGSSIDRLAPYNEVVRGEGVAFAHHALDGLIKVWVGWRRAEGQEDEVARNLAASFIARNLDLLLTEQSSDPTAVAFVTFLGETLTTKEYAIRMQAQRLADVVSGITTSYIRLAPPLHIVDDSSESGYESQTTDVIHTTFSLLGLEDQLRRTPATPRQFQDDNSVGYRRTAILDGPVFDGQVYKLVWDVHERTNRQVLSLQMAAAPES